MRVKKANLKYYVFYISNDKIERFNILGGRTNEEIAKRINHKIYNIHNYNSFKENMRTYFKGRYWSRCEYEYIVSDLSNKEQVKLDVWYQIEPNLDLICKHINEEMRLGF